MKRWSAVAHRNGFLAPKFKDPNEMQPSAKWKVVANVFPQTHRTFYIFLVHGRQTIATRWPLCLKTFRSFIYFIHCVRNEIWLDYVRTRHERCIYMFSSYLLCRKLGAHFSNVQKKHQHLGSVARLDGKCYLKMWWNS